MAFSHTSLQPLSRQLTFLSGNTLPLDRVPTTNRNLASLYIRTWYKSIFLYFQHTLIYICGNKLTESHFSLYHCNCLSVYLSVKWLLLLFVVLEPWLNIPRTTLGWVKRLRVHPSSITLQRRHAYSDFGEAEC